MKRKQLQFLLTLIFFAAAVALYFMPHGDLRISLAFPAFVLTLGSVCLSPWALTMALLFCAVGDVMGVLGSLPGQMGAFAVGHLFFIFLLGRSVVESRPRVRIWLPAVAVGLAVLFVVGRNVIPVVPGVPLKIGCMVYALLLISVFGLAVMAALAGQQQNTCKPHTIVGWCAVVAAVGAGLFVFSDFVLAWNLFVERVAHARYFIMCTYYSAILLLFVALTVGRMKR